MSEEKVDTDLSKWFSSYGLITAKRILENYKIKLVDEDLLYALKTPNNFYHTIMRMPLKNVFNGIIMQQARDYQLYAQKLFIDYLLSGETGKVEEAPGGNTRDDLEAERQTLLKINEAFHIDELAQEQLISESQRKLRHYAEEWQKKLLEIAKEVKHKLIADGINRPETTFVQLLTSLLVHYDFAKGDSSISKDVWARAEKTLETSLDSEQHQLIISRISELRPIANETEQGLTDYFGQGIQMGSKMRNYRKVYHDLIIRINELIKLLPDYRIDEAQVQENQESLLFDASLGEDKK
ncbi:hypothetical protein Lbir_2111 [Legionella birminghamensis]|uniref:Uncharacterized protein n=2 Tax=Legionella birminghamensis TaxID=28083 RepID=A0A378IA29_9GAMM|nr:hypothetical protein [Legionella birminghamensis]KTC69372.1 hypothetical protein Lbir_2111 [Legionella birminghamensis]STX31635.1 Uncharacterised protein [Legionella birminghamensis]